ncbi:MAG: cellulose binding domain-containing protein [Actinoallomurus sp.]
MAATADERDDNVLPHLRATDEIPMTARPVPATDVQVHPVVPPPRPYAAPVTVEESIPYPPTAPRGPTDPARARGWRVLGVSIVVIGALLLGSALLLVSGVFAGGPERHPCGHRPCVVSPSVQVAAPGPRIAYRTVERDAGYFEGTVTIVNPTDRPMRSWTLSFRYPGADIHNTWDAALSRSGTEIFLAGTATSPPIAPGATLQVRFGGSGSPSMPADCRLNGTPCAFVAG